MIYEVTITADARRELKRLSGPIVVRITKKLYALGQNPRPPGCLKMKGFDGIMWRVRVGDYRILYTIEDVLRIVDIRKIGPRGDVYER